MATPAATPQWRFLDQVSKKVASALRMEQWLAPVLPCVDAHPSPWTTDVHLANLHVVRRWLTVSVVQRCVLEPRDDQDVQVKEAMGN